MSPLGQNECKMLCNTLWTFSTPKCHIHYNDVIMGTIASQSTSHDCFLNRLFRRRSKKTSKLRVTGLCAENSPGTGEFPAQMASNAGNVSIWWRHHVVGGWLWHNLKKCRDATFVVSHWREAAVITNSGTASDERGGIMTSLGFRWLIGKFVYRINTLRPKQNGRHFADDTFKYIFLNENVIISVKISLKFVPKGPINNNPALVQIMAWRRPKRRQAIIWINDG